MEKTEVKPQTKSKPNLSRKMSTNWTNFQNTIPKSTKSLKKIKVNKTTQQPPIQKDVTLTNALAIDCEMVGIRGNNNMLARVSIINEHGEIVMDKNVKPTVEMVDYRAYVSGIRPKDIECIYLYLVLLFYLQILNQT